MNITRGEFGYDGDTIEDVRRKLPRFLRTQDRAVTGMDYKTLADQFATSFHGQVGKSNAILRNHGCAGNIIDLYILARDGTSDLIKAGNELKVELTEALNDKKMLTDYICIRDGKVLSVDIAVEATADKFFRKFEQEARTRITENVSNFFSINNWEYNKDLKDVDLIKSLAPIESIQSYEIDFQTNDADNSGNLVTAAFDEIIRPGTVDITFLYV